MKEQEAGPPATRIVKTSVSPVMRFKTTEMLKRGRKLPLPDHYAVLIKMLEAVD